MKSEKFEIREIGKGGIREVDGFHWGIIGNHQFAMVPIENPIGIYDYSKSAPHLSPRTPASCGKVVEFGCPTEIVPARGRILEILGGLGEILEDSIKQIEEIWRIWNQRRGQNLDFY